jgi:hypothetical protein
MPAALQILCLSTAFAALRNATHLQAAYSVAGFLTAFGMTIPEERASSTGKQARANARCA